MKTAIIITGGTILSEESEGFFSLSDNKIREILSLVPDGFEAEVFSPYFIHSEQLNGEYLTALISETHDKLKRNFGGIIILHGTDTLQFSAAALSLAYSNADIPIVLVSANYILSDERSNGRDNLKYAFRFIELEISGVFVSYRNAGENPSIYPGHTLLPHLTCSDRLFSIGGAYGYFENDSFKKLTDELKHDAIGKYTLVKNSPILWIKAAAGFDMPDTGKYQAVLLETYHSGTLPTESESFIRFCKNCGKPVYIIGVSEGARYVSTKEYQKLNLRILPPISPVFAYILLWQKYSQ